MKEGTVIKSAGTPGPEEMAEVNRYTRRAYLPEEVYTFALVLCDNEIDRDFERFAVESLEKLRGLFLGKTCILDHERKSVNQTARIYHTELEQVQGEATQAGEPLVRLTARAYLPRTEGTKETVELIDSGILKEVSVSCSVQRTVCGLCGKERCAHEKGKTYGGRLAHRVLLDPADAYECSFVAVPAQRGAGVVKSHGARGVSVEKLLQCPPGEDVLLTKGQVKEIGRRFQELAERARWGGQYRRELERDVLKYSALVQPDMPRAVMEAALKGLDMEALAQMEKTYERMAQRSLPLKPQLAAERPEQHARNSEFQI